MNSFQVGVFSPSCYRHRQRQEIFVRHAPLTVLSDPTLSRAMPSLSTRESSDRHRLVRGLVHGVLLSLVIWAAAGYVAFTLR